ncbi:hypothetical protein KFL_001440110 [Klebsormidium nitens]|uniref:ZF-HD dimerization-type domain-containing protein n=1 Tax=Klebsormidium nitens TaxID=105231 RepID=A0A1Y1HYQ6_KLENI|nr:hypothetical protein KFL_001440110 [Klebsormidium nitens]|eukprot:GAQ83323.1 hypothetical protein KFL_001440110 [Klebsormidium nitens]
MVQLGKCLRVKGVGNGVTSIDGCQAFSPRPKKPEKCAACGCHASFHQRLDGSGAYTSADAGAGVPGPVAASSQPPELAILPKRGQVSARGVARGGARKQRSARVPKTGGVRAEKAGAEVEKAGGGDAEKPAAANRPKRGPGSRGGKVVVRGAGRGRKSKQLVKADGGASGGKSAESVVVEEFRRGSKIGEQLLRKVTSVKGPASKKMEGDAYMGPGSRMLTISRKAARLGLTVDHVAPKVGKGEVDEFTITEAAAKLGMNLDVRIPGEENATSLQRARTIAAKAKGLGLVLPEKPTEEGGVGTAVPGFAKASAAMSGSIVVGTGIVDLTAEGEAQGAGTKRRAAEEIAGDEKKARPNFGGRVEAWMKAALQKSWEQEGGSAQQSGEEGEAGSSADSMDALGQEGMGRGDADLGVGLSGLVVGQVGVRTAGKAGAAVTEPKKFGDGILFARKTLADLLSEKAWLEKDLAFQEVDFQNKHLFFLRSKLTAKGVIDMYDARLSTRIVVAYLGGHEKDLAAVKQPVGTVRVVTQRPFPCEKKPLVAEWIESKNGSNVAEVSHLLALQEYRNGSVSVPLLAYAYMRILKPADVKYVVIVTQQKLVERYLMKHFLFLGFEFIEQTGNGECVLALDLEKAVGLLYGPWRFT